MNSRGLGSADPAVYEIGLGAIGQVRRAHATYPIVDRQIGYSLISRGIEER